MNLNILVYDGISLYDNFGTGNNAIVYDEAWINGALYDFITIQEYFNTEIIYFLTEYNSVSVAENFVSDLQSNISISDLIHATENLGIMLWIYINKYENISISEYKDNIIINADVIPVEITIIPRARIFISAMKTRIFDVNSRYRVFKANIQKTIEKK
jgi:predicted transglutaminase-like protease